MKKGIALEDVAAEIGALSREKFEVEREELITGICDRFQVSYAKAESVIEDALNAEVVEEKNGIIKLIIK